MKIGRFDVNIRTSVCDLTVSDGAYGIAFTRNESADIAKQLACYAETGKLNTQMVRYALGWNEANRRFRFHAWEGVGELDDNGIVGTTFFENKDVAGGVMIALFGPDSGVKVLRVNVIERDGALVECDDA